MAGTTRQGGIRRDILEDMSDRDRVTYPVFLALCGVFLSMAASCATKPTTAPEARGALPSSWSMTKPWPDSAFLEIEGYRLHYRILPASTSPAGETGLSAAPVKGKVLLVHGFGASVFTWRYLGPAIQAEGYQVVEVDYPPFGWSTGTELLSSGLKGDSSGSPAARADLLWAFLDAIPAVKAEGGWIIVGHSLGGASGSSSGTWPG